MKTKNEVKHTPTPWRVTANEHIVRHIPEESLDDFHVCQTYGPQASDNAAFIVRAVSAFNAHEELLRCLTEMVMYNPDETMRERARQAIAKAEGQTEHSSEAEGK